MSETDFLKLKKHDNVETNTEKFDIENYLNGNWDKINKNAKEVNTKISNINSNNTELEKELKEAQEDFYQASVRGQASGEYIHVEDSSNCRARIGISGNSEQDMRSGKNYLNTLAKYKAGEKVTVDGITYIFNEDGSITCNGTATADSVLTFSSNLQTINGSGKKIVGMITGTQVPAKLSILAYTSDWSKNTFELLSSVNKNITINMQENIDYTIFRIIAYKGTTLNNQTIYYQILDTSVNDLTYEQYGVSPSPDYQSPVKTVGSNVNYYNKETEKIGFVLSDGSLQPNNTVWTHSDFIEVNSNEIISITCENKANGQFAIVEYDKNKKFLKHNMGNYVNTEANNKYTITTTGTTKYIIGAYRNNLNMNNIMVVKGAEVLPYNPNCNNQGSVKVTKCNKNLLDSSILENKILDSKTGSATTNTSWKASDFIQINSGIYNFSWKSSSNYFQVTICFYDRNKNFLSGISWAIANVYSKSFEVDENTTFIRVSYSSIISGKEANREKIILEQNLTETDYEQHEEQSYIMPVQKEMLQGDYFDFDNEEEVHTKAKLVLTGNENWKLESTGRFGIMKSDLSEIPAAASSDNDYLGNMCNSYKESTPALTWKKEQGFCVDGTSCLRIYDDKYSTNNDLEGFKTYLKSKYDAGTPVMIYYKLATPNRLKFTDEQKAVAKELNNARTYKNVTNITTDSKAVLSLDYAKDLEELTEYSTEERVIGRWIDGKPLYSKVGSIKFTSVYDSSGLHTRGSLIDSDIDYGTVSKVLNKNLLSSSLFNTYGTSTSNVYVENRQGNSNKGYILGFTDRTDLLNTTIYVVVEYTKTTD